MPMYDIAISGAGPVGSALALLLAAQTTQPQRIVVLGRGLTALREDSRTDTAKTRRVTLDDAPKQEQLAPETPVGPVADPRTLAMNHGSRVLLTQLGAWPSTAAEITTVHVSQRGRLGRTLIRHQELGVARLGNVVAYDDVLSSLHTALAHSGVTLRDVGPNTHHLTSGSDHAGKRVALSVNGEDMTTALLIRSDGAKPQGIIRQYDQDALLATVRVSRPRKGWAYERFTKRGPLAFLPHPAGESFYAIVWCNPPQVAARLKSLTLPQFNAQLQEAFGDRLGEISCLGERHVFPLAMHAGPSLLGPRRVAIGNAAQTLHPVAGQGLNLGLRDAAQLALTLAPWQERPQEDPSALLEAFARRRRPDRWLTAGVTDFLPRFFATGNPLLEHAAGLALLGLDIFPALRLPLARHLLQGLRT